MELSPDTALKHAARAEDAAEQAQALRLKLRKRTDPTSRRRGERIEAALRQIDNAMRPLRADIGRLVWTDVPVSVEKRLRAASAACQLERRKLKKMRRPR